MKDKIFFSIDPVIFTLKNEVLHVLLIDQNDDQISGDYRLPGGVLDTDLSFDLGSAAVDTLIEKAGITAKFFEQLKTYGGKKRDTRGWTVATAYMGVVNYESVANKDLKNNANFVNVEEALELSLAFDHKEMIEDAVARLKNKVNYSLLPANFLPEEFTMASLQKIYEQILGEKLDKSSFIKKIRETNAIEAVEGEYQTGNFRPAQLWRLKNLHHFEKNLLNLGTSKPATITDKKSHKI